MNSMLCAIPEMNFAASAIFWILIGLAAAAVFVFVERFVQLRRARIDWHDFLKGVINVLESGNEEEALAICEDTSVPVTNIVATAIRHRKGGAVALREAVDAQGRSELARLDRRLTSLSVIGQIAPLLGLMAALIGFAQTISVVNLGIVVQRSELIVMASKAVVSAIIGLGVAIPVAVMDTMLRLRMERLTADLEAAATEIVGYLLSKGDNA
jgi:biopolymer transport protein ExbB